jgi:hypothetical protein
MRKEQEKMNTKKYFFAIVPRSAVNYIFFLDSYSFCHHTNLRYFSFFFNSVQNKKFLEREKKLEKNERGRMKVKKIYFEAQFDV